MESSLWSWHINSHREVIEDTIIERNDWGGYSCCKLWLLDSWDENKEVIIASSIKRFEDSGFNNEALGIHLEMTDFFDWLVN